MKTEGEEESFDKATTIGSERKRERQRETERNSVVSQTVSQFVRLD